MLWVIIFDNVVSKACNLSISSSFNALVLIFFKFYKTKYSAIPGVLFPKYVYIVITESKDTSL